MERSVQLALFLLLSFPILSLAARGGYGSSRRASAATSHCARTRDPRLCVAATQRVRNVPASNNIEGVLRSNLVAISNRCTSAKKQALGLLRRSPPKTRAALKDCADLYANAVDLIGVSTRALNDNDGQTGQMVKIMLQQIKQSAEQCNAQFARPGTPNPLARLNGSLIMMTNNANDLNNAMNTKSSARRA
ncbi:Pectinesterase inhibitor domain containing protein [Rhynchospora pubera]|nr:Pectinesterase inhibitor domain containing protein [Rhynchospora pubera]KAJ4775951.1 Pectinesterase inhibitor domain containing protein [Rhynchospora pubera]KAJ4802073.1 Pectinesterase inhibitor domain containing protein [Rhynchospora pubera]